MTTQPDNKNITILKPIFIEGLLKIKDWFCKENAPYLRSIFDQVGFQDRDGNKAAYYTMPASLNAEITFPVQKGEIKTLKTEKEKVLTEINKHYKTFSPEYLNSLSPNQLFFLLEKFGSNIPADETELTSTFDKYKIKAAKKIIRENRKSSTHNESLLINIDISGIQGFIYNISSSGALKNLRSRSFFIELLSNHIIYKILNAFDLHYVNVLMNGGGSIYILSGCPKDYESILNQVNYQLNQYLLQEFNGRLYAAFSQVQFTDKELENKLSQLLKELARKTFKEKQRKFNGLITKGEFQFINENEPEYQGCEICYKDEAKTALHQINQTENRYRCSFCERLVTVGSQIPKAKFIYKCNQDTSQCIQIEDSYYRIENSNYHSSNKNAICLWVVYEDDPHFIDHLQGAAAHIFARTYTKKNKDLPKKVYKKMGEVSESLSEEKKYLEASLSNEQSNKEIREEIQILEEEIQTLKDDNTTTINYMAESSQGAKLIGALRMDADNVGKFLHDGFYGETALEILSSFSRNLNYFFKLHLEFLCKEGLHKENEIPALALKSSGNVHVIYAGGDDLFALGAWSDVASLAIDISAAFNKYTCGNDNIDLGISGGLTIHNAKFPVSKMAIESMSALKTAKNNYQSCWMCKKNWVKCPLFDLGYCLRKDSLALFYTDSLALKKKKLDEKHTTPKYEAKPLRLKLALKRKYYDTGKGAIIDEIDALIIKPLAAFYKGRRTISRVFFHNILSLLDVWYEEGMLYLPKVAYMIQKFKSELKRHCGEAESGTSLYDLYEMYLYFHDKKRFSSLHMPLSWIIFLMKGEKNDENKTP